MKQKILIAAGLLCLGTSPAFAFTIPAMAPDMAKAVKDVWADQLAAEKPGIFDTGEAWMGESKLPKFENGGANSFDDSLASKADDAESRMAPGDPDLDRSAKS